MKAPPRLAGLLVLAAALVVCLGPRTALTREGKRVEVEADRLSIDHRARTASFEGNVVAHYSDLILTCDTMHVTYDESGEIASLKASGKVAVTRADVSATAAAARLDARLGLLVLEGKPVLLKGNSRLEGKRITVSLATGKVEVTKARGVFRLGASEGR